MFMVHHHIAHHLESMTNNKEQTFGREKHFHVHTTLFLNNYAKYKNLSK